MKNTNHRICPVEKSGFLENRLRRWVQNPEKILSPYVKKGMTVLDMGAGPGFFSIPMANMVGDTGHVVACDLQQGMLDRIAFKIKGTGLENTMTLHQCEPDTLNINRRFDFVLAFYVVHELQGIQKFFNELNSLIHDGGKVLVVEPRFHVPRKDFGKTILMARNSGFLAVRVPGFLLSYAALLVRG